MATIQLESAAAAASWLKAHVLGATGATLRCDSRRIARGDVFVAWPGGVRDPRAYVHDALSAGAAACLVEAEGAASFGFDDARIAALAQLKPQTGAIAHDFFGQPSARLPVLAITGTNGKTSIAWWLAMALGQLGKPCAVVGTLGIGVPPHVVPTGWTTPDPATLHAAFAHYADQGFAACAIEASSIGITEQRLNGTHIDVALFSNFTQDHLDYHGSMAAYWAAKRALFAWPGLRAAVVNIDDPHGAALATELHGLALWTVSTQQAARLRAQGVHYVDGGLAFEVLESKVLEGDRPEDEGLEADLSKTNHRAVMRTALVGDYNVNNLLVVLGALRALGVPLADAAAVLPRLTAVPGRLQRISTPAQTAVVVDYAHTPDALDKVLHALKPLARAQGGALWCVFGCGGDRDAGKRPLMGAIASRLADHVVITSDNPRSEAPSYIIAQVLAGVARVDGVDVIEDRAEAIDHALRHAARQDLVLIAGKGHEDYQEVAGVRRPFSDALVAQAVLRELRELRPRDGAAA